MASPVRKKETLIKFGTRRHHFSDNLIELDGLSGSNDRLKNIVDLLIDGDFIPDPGETFDCALSYYPIFPALLAAIDRRPSAYLGSVVQSRPIQRFDDRSFHDVKRLQKSKPAYGLTLAEIGGSVAARLMDLLGAAICFADGRYDSQKKLETGNPVKDQESLVNLDHYKHIFPGKYDLSVSNNLFVFGSGIEATGSSDFHKGNISIWSDFSRVHQCVFSRCFQILQDWVD